jgi:hypothetical protein
MFALAHLSIVETVGMVITEPESDQKEIYRSGPCQKNIDIDKNSLPRAQYRKNSVLF